MGTDAQGADELGGVGAESQTMSSELQLPPPASSGLHQLHLGVSLCLPLSLSLCVYRVPSASPASVSLRVSLPLPLSLSVSLVVSDLVSVASLSRRFPCGPGPISACFYACPLQMSACEGSFCLSGSQRCPNPSNSAWQTGGAQ